MILRSKNKVVITLKNGTESPSVLGSVVALDPSNDDTYVASSATEVATAIGVVTEANVPVGGRVKIVTCGLAYVLNQPAVATNAGAVVRVSRTKGGTAAANTIPVSSAQSLGIAFQSVAADTVFLALIDVANAVDIVVVG